jgi:hypothetical protein
MGEDYYQIRSNTVFKVRIVVLKQSQQHHYIVKVVKNHKPSLYEFTNHNDCNNFVDELIKSIETEAREMVDRHNKKWFADFLNTNKN